jgi:hypothetical protein
MAEMRTATAAEIVAVETADEEMMAVMVEM